MNNYDYYTSPPSGPSATIIVVPIVVIICVIVLPCILICTIAQRRSRRHEMMAYSRSPHRSNENAFAGRGNAAAGHVPYRRSTAGADRGDQALPRGWRDEGLDVGAEEREMGIDAASARPTSPTPPPPVYTPGNFHSGLESSSPESKIGRQQI